MKESALLNVRLNKDNNDTHIEINMNDNVNDGNDDVEESTSEDSMPVINLINKYKMCSDNSISVNFMTDNRRLVNGTVCKIRKNESSFNVMDDDMGYLTE